MRGAALILQRVSASTKSRMRHKGGSVDVVNLFSNFGDVGRG